MAEHVVDSKRVSIWERLRTVDRRVIFVVLFVGVFVPFLKPLGLPVNVTRPCQQLYDHIDQLEEHTPVLISFDYGPGTAAELDPMGVALAQHCFQRNLRVIGMTLSIDGAPMVESALAQAAADSGKEKRVDWVNLGFRPGVQVVIMGIGSGGIGSVFPADSESVPLAEIPVMDGIRDYGSFGAVMTLSSWASPGAWVAFAHEPFDAPVACGVTGVMAPDYYTYLQSGQLIGILGGLKGAAEYETLVHKPGDGLRGMDSQSFAHIVIVLFVIIGNIAAIQERRAKAPARGV